MHLKDEPKSGMKQFQEAAEVQVSRETKKKHRKAWMVKHGRASEGV